MRLKIKFKVRLENGKDDELTHKINKDYIYQFSNNGLSYKFFNAVKLRVMILIVSLDNKTYYWCATMPYDMIFKSYPMMRADAHKFKKGFKTKILEALVNAHIKKITDTQNPETFNTFIQSTVK
jgi:hypothetical protein